MAAEDLRLRLREAGEAFYRELPDHLADRMRCLFATLDRDGNAKVSSTELKRGCHRIESLKPFATVLPHLFPLLDADSNGSLDFSECKALFLLLSSAVYCSSCASHLTVLAHFSCLDCDLPVCFRCHPSSPHAHHRVDNVIGIADDPQLYAQRILMSYTAKHHNTSGIKINPQISSTMRNIVVNPNGQYAVDRGLKGTPATTNSQYQFIENVITIGNSFSSSACDIGNAISSSTTADSDTTADFATAE